MIAWSFIKCLRRLKFIVAEDHFGLRPSQTDRQLRPLGFTNMDSLKMKMQANLRL